MAMVDLGRMDQAIWNTLHGKLLVGTFEFGNASRLIAHSEFIYLLIAPLYLIYSDPKTILVLQTFFITLGALPIFWIGYEKTKSYFFGLCFSCAYLLYPPIQYGNLNDFHPDMLATSFLFFAFYYAMRKSRIKYFSFLILAIMCKEYISLIAVMMGIYIFRKDKKIAIFSFFAGVCWFLITYKIMPILFSRKENMLIEFYSHVGNSSNEILKNIILHPIKLFLEFTTIDRIINSIALLLPLGFLSFFNLPILLIAFPVFIGLVLSPFFSYANHHNGTLIPFMFISAIYGASYLINRLKYGAKLSTYGVSVFVLSASLFSTISYGASPIAWRFWSKPSYHHWDNLHQFRITKHDKIADKFIKMIPSEASVSASNHLGSHLSHREIIYQFPHPKRFKKIDYILVDILEYFPPSWIPRQEDNKILKDLILNDGFGIKYTEDGILLFEKEYSKKDRFKLSATSIKEIATPAYPVNLNFADILKMRGYDLDLKDFYKGRRVRLTYYWQVLNNFDRKFSYNYFGTTEQLQNNYIVIDKFSNGPAEFRIVHLPIYLLHTPKDWKPGEVIKEEMDFFVPDNIPLGDFSWKIGLYVVPENFFIDTQRINLVPGTKQIDLGAVRINERGI